MSRRDTEDNIVIAIDRIRDVRSALVTASETGMLKIAMCIGIAVAPKRSKAARMNFFSVSELTL